MILILVKMPIREDRLEQWRELSRQYTIDVNNEPGCEFFEISQSLTDPLMFITNEGFRDDAAGRAHMASPHVPAFMEAMRDIVSAQPEIIYVDADEVTGFGPMGEITPR